MKMPKVRRETAVVATGAMPTIVLTIITGIGGVLELAGLLDAKQFTNFTDAINELWYASIGLLGAGSAGHVAREHVRRQEKKDAADAEPDYASMSEQRGD